MPVYNAEAYLKESVSSVINQSYDNWELLIINDGSTDNSEKVIKTFEDSRIKYFFQQNHGTSAARNVGLAHSSGKFICFLDADDSFTKDSVLNRIKIFHKNSNVEFVDGVVLFFDKYLKNPLNKWCPGFKGHPLKELISLSGKVFFGNTWMIKINKSKTYEFKEGLTHSEDLLFYIKIVDENCVYDYTKEPILKYRTGHRSAMKNIKGIEKGYYEVFKELTMTNIISQSYAKLFRKKARKIIFKSYLGNYKILRAINFLRSSW